MLPSIHPRSQSSVPSPEVAEYTEVRVGTKFLKAAQWAADRHVEYAGDVPGIPTVAQVLGLATLVLEDGGSQREAIAAMLLDALADDVPRKELRRQFGKKTTRLVDATHAHRGTVAPGRVPVDADRWRQRADAALDVAVTEVDDDALRIRAACVLQETRTLLRELAAQRDDRVRALPRAADRAPRSPARVGDGAVRRRPCTLLTQELRAWRGGPPAVGAGDRHARLARHPRRVADSHASNAPSAPIHAIVSTSSGTGLPVCPACAIESSAVFTHFFSAVS